MANEIIYGVGQSILKDFTDSSKVIGLSKLKNVSVETTGNEDPIYGGDSPYPFANFPRDKEINISAESATFSLSTLNITQGADIKTVSVPMTELKTIIIPDDGIVPLGDDAIVDDTIIVSGYTKTTEEASVSVGEFYFDSLTGDIKFNVDDSGTEVDIIYERMTSEDTKVLSVYENTLAKPVVFIHRIPIYDDNNTIVANGQLIVYKAKANNNFTFDFQSQTAFAPRLELQALDPKRPDKKLWDFTMEPIVNN